VKRSDSIMTGECWFLGYWLWKKIFDSIVFLNAVHILTPAIEWVCMVVHVWSGFVN